MESQQEEGVRETLSKRINWVIVLVLSVVTVIAVSSFLRAWRVEQALRHEVAELQPLLTAAMAEQQALKATLAYVQTDAYVEAWAKGRAKMTLPGETLVIPVFAEATPTPMPTPRLILSVTPTPEPSVSLFVRWWQALLGR